MRRALVLAACAVPFLIASGCNDPSKSSSRRSQATAPITSGSGVLDASGGPLAASTAQVGSAAALAVSFENTGNDPVELSSVTVTASGSIDESTAIGAVTLVGDDNGNGAIDAGERVLAASATPAFAVDDGSVTVTLAQPVTVGAGATLDLVVVAEVRAVGAAALAVIGETLELSIVAAADIVAASGGKAIAPGGTFPVSSGPVTLYLHDHLLISELVTSTTADYIEIVNPTDQAVDLSNYYLTEQQDRAPGTKNYYQLPQGRDFDARLDTDFLVRFPAGATIAPGQIITVAVLGDEFFNDYGMAPDYAVVAYGQGTQMLHADTATPPNWTATPNFTAPLDPLLVTAENVVLAYWDGQSDLVQDVDVVQPGAPNGTNFHFDKNNVSVDGPDADTTPSTYLPETPVANRAATPNPTSGSHAIQRVDFTEGGETKTTGNGITGHDETSEPVDVTFILGVPTPGQP